MPRSAPPRHIERQFGKAIVVLLRPLRTIVRGIVLPHLSEVLTLGPHVRSDADFRGRLDTTINAARVAYAERVPETDVKGVAEEATEAISGVQREQLRAQASSALGVDPLRGEPWLADIMRDAVRANVDLIKTIPEQYFDRLATTIRTGVLDGQRHEDLAKEIESSFLAEDGDDWAKAENRAALIARDQTMKFFGTLARVRQEDLGIVAYVWRTSMDERVRPEHADREGATFRWDDPPEDGHPGMPIQCRCVADPIFPEDAGESKDVDAATDANGDPIPMEPEASARAHKYETVYVPIDALTLPEGPQHEENIAANARWVESGRPLGMPTVGLGEGDTLQVRNGAHRIDYLRRRGVEVLPVSVPPEDADAITALIVAG